MTNIYSIRRHIHMNNKMNSIIFVIFLNVYEFYINWPLYQISTICSWKNQFGKWSEIFKGLEFYWCDNELVSHSVIHHRYGRYILNVISFSCCHLFFPLTIKIGENGCMPFIFDNKYCKSTRKLAICYLVHTQFVCRNYVGHIFISIFIRSPANAHNSHKCVWFRVRWIWLSIKIELSFIAGDDIVYMR